MPLSSLEGNLQLKQQLLPRLTGRRLSHATIVSGPEGSGTHSLAKILARGLVCSGTGSAPCGTCADCRKAAADIHPDIITIRPEPDKKAVSVDQIRQMRADAHIRPNEAPRKVYILEGADRMQGEGQNAMLKLLEEGPAYAAFILLARNSGALLTTVRSRCDHLRLSTDEQVVDRLLAEQADRLAECWLSGDEQAMMDLCVPLEKSDRQQVVTLLELLRGQFCDRLADHPDRRNVLRGVQLLDWLLQATQRNVGTGHLLGWLCAEVKGQK
ncbi:MAG: DNA polymerase III subunit delta [Ruminococcaceae bacterium]|nr:DNA polymerase III subunit delta [Oscillospiraceae bacterium]